jgi:hypothetical protein
MLVIPFFPESALCCSCFHLGCSMFWALYVSLCTHNMQDDGCKTWQGEKQTERRADRGKKNCNSTLVLTALTTMGLCNVRAYPTSELWLTLLAAPCPHGAMSDTFFMKKVPDSAQLGRWGAIWHHPVVTILSRKSIAPYIWEAMWTPQVKPST